MSNKYRAVNIIIRDTGTLIASLSVTLLHHLFFELSTAKRSRLAEVIAFPQMQLLVMISSTLSCYFAAIT
ncbi:hypothetical protein FIBSPDRAFT_400877 [Athelia psychrophila]|uniref:Uncharacterized protein n=1 Tax=Athelia psychrophila TaxID=1759441 RepID=A0A166NGT4_9AGAM|nr:hypothetical protein FIBSPDRAFT_400877 [Fibularhizoctonia sp. CBS 109695]